MRRMLTLVLATSAVLAIAPAVALAHRHHHHHHHHRSHVRHSRIHHERFGRASQTQSGGSEDTAGTVTSFDNGVLTITLNDNNGTMVSGQVTDATELECTASSSSTQTGDDNGDNDQNSGDNGDQSGDDNGSNSGDDNGSNDDQGDEGQMCTTASLTPGTVVREAELKINSSGATWDKVELVTS